MNSIKKQRSILSQADFTKHNRGMIGVENFNQYAVLAALADTDQGPALVFEKRSEDLNRQPGEICFPGGRLEDFEKPAEGAVRETMEELLVSRDQIDVLGPGDIFISPFNIIIHPFIARIRDYKYTYSLDEVAEVFTVPLRFFQENKPVKYFNHLVHEVSKDFPYESIPGGKNYPWAKGSYEISFYQYGDTVIWGMTARMVESVVLLIERYHLLDD
jgi:8-oxo-dGTP pyrophosphatase MutT (NUDIX family)